MLLNLKINQLQYTYSHTVKKGHDLYVRTLVLVSGGPFEVLAWAMDSADRLLHMISL